MLCVAFDWVAMPHRKKQLCFEFLVRRCIWIAIGSRFVCMWNCGFIAYWCSWATDSIPSSRKSIFLSKPNEFLRHFSFLVQQLSIPFLFILSNDLRSEVNQTNRATTKCAARKSNPDCHSTARAPNELVSRSARYNREKNGFTNAQTLLDKCYLTTPQNIEQLAVLTRSRASISEHEMGARKKARERETVQRVEKRYRRGKRNIMHHYTLIWI